MKYRGKTHRFGDNVNTDEIIPAHYLNLQDPAELGARCMEGADKNFAKKVKKGDIIVGGKNFGCGSSREHAPIAIQACGVSCVIAESFARIFYRNSINMGLPIVQCEKAAREIKAHHTVEVDTKAGTITDKTAKKAYRSEVHPHFIQKIIRKGGLMNYVKR
jgi:3-isopropylmalate/(R)-2-methylmalate dehydratase small subunit